MQLRRRGSQPTSRPAATPSIHHQGTRNGGPPNLEDIVQNYSIAKIIGESLRPLDRRKPLYDLSSLTKASKALNIALAPFLFRSVQLGDMSNMPSSRMISFFKRWVEWRPEVYLMVRELTLPAKCAIKTFAYIIDFALRCPNLRQLALPHRDLTGFLPDVSPWVKLEVLRCAFVPDFDNTATNESRIKILHLRTIDVLKRSSKCSTSAKDLFLYGTTYSLFSGLFSGSERSPGPDWTRLGPRAKRIRISVDASNEWLEPRSALPSRFRSSRVREFSIFVSSSPIRDNQYFTPFTWTQSLSETVKQIVDCLTGANKCSRLRVITLAIQPTWNCCPAGWGVYPTKHAKFEAKSTASVQAASPSGKAIELAREHSLKWQIKNFELWKVCIAKKDDEGSWTYKEVDQLIWKGEENYPFVA